jgi:hypothetical protein
VLNRWEEAGVHRGIEGAASGVGEGGAAADGGEQWLSQHRQHGSQLRLLALPFSHAGNHMLTHWISKPLGISGITRPMTFHT